MPNQVQFPDTFRNRAKFWVFEKELEAAVNEAYNATNKNPPDNADAA